MGKELRNALNHPWLNYAVPIDQLRPTVEQILSGKYVVEKEKKDKKPAHPITRGLTSFETVDELYHTQQGNEPVEVLATARSKQTRKDEPMAFVYSYGDGRVFQTVLGHAEESLRTAEVARMIRRACFWAAGREPLSPEDAASVEAGRQSK